MTTHTEDDLLAAYRELSSLPMADVTALALASWLDGRRPTSTDRLNLESAETAYRHEQDLVDAHLRRVRAARKAAR